MLTFAASVRASPSSTARRSLVLAVSNPTTISTPATASRTQQPCWTFCRFRHTPSGNGSRKTVADGPARGAYARSSYSKSGEFAPTKRVFGGEEFSATTRSSYSRSGEFAPTKRAFGGEEFSAARSSYSRPREFAPTKRAFGGEEFNAAWEITGTKRGGGGEGSRTNENKNKKKRTLL